MAERGFCNMGKKLTHKNEKLHQFYVIAHVMFLPLQVSYLAADSFFPEWNVWIQFLEESTIGFRLDALAGSHPIEVTLILCLSACDAISRSIPYTFL